MSYVPTLPRKAWANCAKTVSCAFVPGKLRLMKCYVLRVRYEGVHGSARILPAAFAVLRGLEAALLSPTSMNPRQSILPGVFCFYLQLSV